ncbi:MAG: hypothetical protein LUC38_07390 [Oscillospiraceae bacterium]|nr:hypothetical protein [Ruminococcus sp.]MCD8345766.1 hypothetical protein [Oscillospiraceae bacterium]
MKNREKRPLGTIDKILLILGGFIGIFTIAMIVTFYIKDAVPDTLITCVMGCGGVEGVLTAAITISKNISGKENQEEHK